MKHCLTVSVAILCLSAFLGIRMAAQEYSAPQVVVSSEKVRYDGKVYYSHVVQERQTLYSICKAYNVTLQEIYDANKTLNLETEGLKKDQIILIPIAKVTVPETEVKEPQVKKQKEDSDFFIHRVKWFEDLNSIAKKYGIPKEAIMGINGMTSEKVRRKDEIKIPIHPEKWITLNSEKLALEGSEGETTDSKADSTAMGDSQSEGIFDKLFSKDKQISMTLLLPFNTSKKADVQMMDFYSGVLLATKDLGADGRKIELNVYDAANSAMPVTEERFAESDFVIGPVSNSDIARAVNASKGKTWIVSPLDPRAESIADTIPNVIQAPAPTRAQISDMAKWIRTDLRDSDKLIVITQKGAAVSGYSANVMNELRNFGLNHSDISFNLLEGRQVMDRIARTMTEMGTNRVVIASDSKAFVIEVIRLLYLISSQKKDIVLYCTSKLRTYDEIDVEQLHALRLHASVSYYVDYDSPQVQDFLMKYRALFGTEPSRTAFQGYDLMKFFSSITNEYGKRWDRASSLKGDGMQSEFNLVRTARGGFVNEAVRRIVYNPDYSVTLKR